MSLAILFLVATVVANIACRLPRLRERLCRKKIKPGCRAIRAKEEDINQERMMRFVFLCRSSFLRPSFTFLVHASCFLNSAP